MPKNKRNKVVPLTKTKKKPREQKDKLIDEIRSCAEKFSRLYLVEIENERNVFLQEVRKQVRPGRLICARNKVMQLALGMEPSSECQDGIHQIAKSIGGSCALLFSNQAPAEIQGFLAGYQPHDFARSGAVATETVTLARGGDALAALPHSIEAHLRQLGLPTQLVQGKVQLLGDHTVCTKGKELSSDAAQILKLLGIKQAQFTVTVAAHWAKEGGKFVDCSDLND
jgi:mRNA turnover protein 4